MGCVSTYTLRSADGTTLQVWDNEAAGIPVLICNGLASSPAAWPAFHDTNVGFHARTWWHRGIQPSQRPPTDDVTIEAHVADARAVTADWDEYYVIGWSLGVNIAAELAASDPRVKGVLALAGVPSGTFENMLTVLGVPTAVSMALSGLMTSGLLRSGAMMSPIAQTLAGNAVITGSLLRLRAIGSSADPRDVHAMVSDFLTMDISWYARLANAFRQQTFFDPEQLSCRVHYVSAARDIVTDPKAVAAAAAATPNAQLERWDASHFLVLEYPDKVVEALRQLAADA